MLDEKENFTGKQSRIQVDAIIEHLEQILGVKACERETELYTSIPDNRFPRIEATH